MQTHSIILWMKKEDFYLYKRIIGGAVFYKEYSIFVMLRQIAPSREMDALIRAERLYHATKDWS